MFSRRASRLLASVSRSSPTLIQTFAQRQSVQRCISRSFSVTYIRSQEATTSAAPALSQAAAAAQTGDSQQLRDLTDGLDDPLPQLNENEKQVDWTRSFHGLSAEAFSDEQAQVLQAKIDHDDIEVKPDGIIYLPEIKYRRILNKAFKPGGWGLAPRGETIITQKLVTREYALVAGGRLISIARGEQQYFDNDGIPTATEGCKSNALMRCCKDLGVASELWDPRFIRTFLQDNAREIIAEHQVSKKRRKHWMRKDDTVKYPWKEVDTIPANPTQFIRRPASATKTSS